MESQELSLISTPLQNKRPTNPHYIFESNQEGSQNNVQLHENQFFLPQSPKSPVNKKSKSILETLNEENIVYIYPKIQSGGIKLQRAKSKHSCPQCTKQFKKNAHLMRHIVEKHQPDVRSYACTEQGCNKTFKRQSHLRRHMITHTGEKPFKCPKCIMSFGYKHHLDRHIRIIHQNQKLKCQEEQCKHLEGFTKKKAFLKHVQKCHSKKKQKNKKTCKKDNQQFQSQNHQQNNPDKSNQNKEMMFRCTQIECISAFRQKKDLKRHILTFHKETLN